MASLQASSYLCTSSCVSLHSQRGIIKASMNAPKLGLRNMSLPGLQKRGLVEELQLQNCNDKQLSPLKVNTFRTNSDNGVDPLVMAKLYAILEAVADRVEMHKNIGEQRNNWNSLLLTSINGITLAAAIMSGIAASSAINGAPVAALKLSSTLMYLGATGMLSIMNKIQPSQLAEEQRNAARLFKQLYNEIQTHISIGQPTTADVKEIMEKVLALDRAFPLPLIGVMLEKFPAKVDPAVWWPEHRRRQAKEVGKKNDWNGWNGKLEKEMREIVGIIERKDKEDYLRLGEKALKFNKLLAIAGPVLTGLAGLGSCNNGSWAAILSVLGGALASIVNAVEHGGQVGMVLEMYRSNAGFFKLMQESIESNLGEENMGRRENGEVFEMKVALKLGRSLSEVRDLAAAVSSSSEGDYTEEFASKLF